MTSTWLYHTHGATRAAKYEHIFRTDLLPVVLKRMCVCWFVCVCLRPRALNVSLCTSMWRFTLHMCMYDVLVDAFVSESLSA